MTITRQNYIGAGLTKVDTLSDEKIGLETYYGETFNGRPVAVMFHGKSQKPVLNYSFANTEHRENSVSNTLKNLKERRDAVAKRKEERNKPSTLKVGDILYTSWGYDQTNIDFYQVTKVIGDRTVEIHQVNSKHVSADYVVPTDAFRMDEASLIKRVSYGNQVRIASYATAWLWDGKPKYETPAGFGH